jgi:2-iminobutanoate/2-iminopropanoate deaminase
MSEQPTKPAGPYTPVVRAGQWLVCSGQVPLRDGQIVDSDIGAATKQCVANIDALLKSSGATLDQVVKTTVFLTDMADFAAMNEAYVEAFGGHRPARSAIGVVALPLGARVEIEAWAWLGG